MNENFKDKLAKLVTGVLVAVILVGGLIAAWPAFMRGESLKRQNEELTRRIAEKQKEIDRLIENQRRFQTDPDFIESIARESRRVYPGELVFIFED